MSSDYEFSHHAPTRTFSVGSRPFAAALRAVHLSIGDAAKLKQWRDDDAASAAKPPKLHHLCILVRPDQLIIRNERKGVICEASVPYLNPPCDLPSTGFAFRLSYLSVSTLFALDELNTGKAIVGVNGPPRPRKLPPAWRSTAAHAIIYQAETNSLRVPDYCRRGSFITLDAEAAPIFDPLEVDETAADLGVDTAKTIRSVIHHTTMFNAGASGDKLSQKISIRAGQAMGGNTFALSLVDHPDLAGLNLNIPRLGLAEIDTLLGRMKGSFHLVVSGGTCVFWSGGLRCRFKMPPGEPPMLAPKPAFNRVSGDWALAVSDLLDVSRLFAVVCDKEAARQFTGSTTLSIEQDVAGAELHLFAPGKAEAGAKTSLPTSLTFAAKEVQAASPAIANGAFYTLARSWTASAPSLLLDDRFAIFFGHDGKLRVRHLITNNFPQ